MAERMPWEAPFLRLAGLDLGQTQDYTALVVIERPVTEPHKPWVCRTLHRWKLGTSYPDIVANVCAWLTLPALAGASLVVDQTGVGRPVVDMFRQRGPVQAVTITGGHTVKWVPEDLQWNVPKKELVAAVQSCLQARRLEISAKLPNADVLRNELANFKVKITASANESYECLVAGTLVETESGPRPIESIKVGDRVLTRHGFKRVLWSGETKRVSKFCQVTLANGSTLQGTPDHLVWTTTRGWVAMGELTCRDRYIQATTVSEKAGTQRLCGLTGWNTASHQPTPTFTTPRPKTHCTVPFGSIITVPYLPVTTFITSTRTQKTTTLPICNACRTQSTPTSIYYARNRKISSVRSVAKPSFAVVSELLGLMTRARRSARSNVPSVLPRDGSTPVFNVVASSLPSAISPPCGSVPAHAETSIATNITTGHPVPVYDLVVDECHEFFANGILVHNSWRENHHDDMVLALALALWLGEQCQHGGATERLSGRVAIPG